MTGKSDLGGNVNVARSTEALPSTEAQFLRLLVRIAENAEAWHGPPPNMGHVRALAVIAGWCREVLGAPERDLVGEPE